MQTTKLCHLKGAFIELFTNKKHKNLPMAMVRRVGAGLAPVQFARLDLVRIDL